mmetsp:Transcript_20869/g.39823  ORF Transcript_20869/g.39823 Transcript_20869/m.39823 type:complete len:266 (+) Transcript_20869:318-1115(+)
MAAATPNRPGLLCGTLRTEVGNTTSLLPVAASGHSEAVVDSDSKDVAQAVAPEETWPVTSSDCMLADLATTSAASSSRSQLLGAGSESCCSPSRSMGTLDPSSSLASQLAVSWQREVVRCWRSSSRNFAPLSQSIVLQPSGVCRTLCSTLGAGSERHRPLPLGLGWEPDSCGSAVPPSASSASSHASRSGSALLPSRSPRLPGSLSGLLSTSAARSSSLFGRWIFFDGQCTHTSPIRGVRIVDDKPLGCHPGLLPCYLGCQVGTI